MKPKLLVFSHTGSYHVNITSSSYLDDKQLSSSLLSIERSVLNLLSFRDLSLVLSLLSLLSFKDRSNVTSLVTLLSSSDLSWYDCDRLASRLVEASGLVLLD